MVVRLLHREPERDFTAEDSTCATRAPLFTGVEGMEEGPAGENELEDSSRC